MQQCPRSHFICSTGSKAHPYRRLRMELPRHSGSRYASSRVSLPQLSLILLWLSRSMQGHVLPRAFQNSSVPSVNALFQPLKLSVSHPFKPALVALDTTTTTRFRGHCCSTAACAFVHHNYMPLLQMISATADDEESYDPWNKRFLQLWPLVPSVTHPFVSAPFKPC